MEGGVLYLLAADLILATHVAFVAFIVFGLVFTLVGKLRSWSWVHNPWFRLIHLAAIGVVVLQSWPGIICPLTTWEIAFREKAGGAVYSGAFIAHWLESILYYRAPEWVFAVSYTAFGTLVIASWYWVPPRSMHILRKQWQGYSRYHQSRTNLVLHIVAVPLFVLGTVLFVVSLLLLAWLSALSAIAMMSMSLLLQGRGHKLEPVPPEPFTGPANAIIRLLAEQWITFPRFVASGAWYRALRSQRAEQARFGPGNEKK